MERPISARRIRRVTGGRAPSEPTPMEWTGPEEYTSSQGDETTEEAQGEEMSDEPLIMDEPFVLDWPEEPVARCPPGGALTKETFDCILEALAQKDFPRFRSYIQNIDYDAIESELWLDVGWFAYFAGSRFHEAWLQRSREMKVKEEDISLLFMYISAFMGNKKTFLEHVPNRPDYIWDEEYQWLLIYAATGGSVPILRHIFDRTKARRILRYDVYIITELVSQAKMYGRPRAAAYIASIEPGSHRDVGGKYIYIKPQLRGGRYSWETFGEEPPQ